MTRSRRVLFSLVAGLLCYVVVEGFAYAGFYVRAGRLFTFDQMWQERANAHLTTEQAFGIEDIPARYVLRKEVVHPYLGYVHDPDVEPASPFGIGDVPPVQARAPDRVVIGFFGGSFAEDIAYHGTDKMVEALAPLFPGREFVVVKAVLGGYKQPQQLMAFNYFTALGGEFDLVINLDGFNEVALPAMENLPATNPFYPRQWHQRVRMIPDPELVAAVGEIRFLDTLSERWAAVFQRAPLRYSVSMNVLWWAGEQMLFNRATARRATLPDGAVEHDDFAATGPTVTFRDDAEMYAQLGRMWAESSYQMHVLATARGARYFHFLQPNQYVEGSKPMSAAEREVAVQDDHPYANTVRQGYPVLQRLGEDLVRRGVHFVDLTGLFATERDVLYRDNCCHVNFEGDDLVGAAIGRAIADAIRAE